MSTDGSKRGDKSAGNGRFRGHVPGYFSRMEAVALARTPCTTSTSLQAGKWSLLPVMKCRCSTPASALEHAPCANGVGLFDVSHMGELWFSGSDAFDFLQHQLAGDIAKASPGRALYTCLLNAAGGIIEDLLVYGFADRYLLVVNAANRAKVVALFESELKGDVHMQDASEQTALLALQGPKSDDVMRAVGLDLRDLAYYCHHKEASCVACRCSLVPQGTPASAALNCMSLPTRRP